MSGWASQTVVVNSTGALDLFATWVARPDAAKRQKIEIWSNGELLESFEADQTKSPSVRIGDTAWVHLGRTPVVEAGTQVEIRFVHEGSGDHAGETLVDGVMIDILGEYEEFSWDHRNRLTTVTRTDSEGEIQSETRFTYDAFDRRISKSQVEYLAGASVRATVTGYVYDAMSLRHTYETVFDLVTETSIGPAQRETYLFDPTTGRPLGRSVETGTSGAPTWSWYLTDQLGSVRDVVRKDAAGGLIHEFVAYSVFGRITDYFDSRDPQNGSDTYSHRFAFHGQELDAETGMQYHQARYFDAGMQQFISEDPLRFAGGSTNLYQYAGNSPVNAYDTNGQFPQAAVTGAIGGAIGAASYLLFTPADKWNLRDGLIQTGAGALAGAAAGATFGATLAFAGAGSGTALTATAAQWVGASVLSGAVGGAVGGFVSTTATELGNGRNIGQALSVGFASAGREAAIGAVAGLFGGLAGRAIAQSFARSTFAMARCEGWKTNVSMAIANVVDGLAGGGAGGGVDGYLRTGTLNGALEGAFVGAGLGGGIAGIGSGMSLAAAKWRGSLACFSAGTPLLSPDGSKPIEAFRPGDLILSRDENLLGGPIEPKVVEEIFVRMARMSCAIRTVPNSCH